jgi:hypothetical protein
MENAATLIETTTLTTLRGSLTFGSTVALSVIVQSLCCGPQITLFQDTTSEGGDFKKMHLNIEKVLGHAKPSTY